MAGRSPAEHEPPAVLRKAEGLVPRHGGYRKLKTFQLARLVYDVTVRFCNRYVDRASRTHDQMVQAARSGVQNIAEASQGSGTSRKMEMKLTNVARASLEELRLDYQDYLRQHELPEWPADHPALRRFKARRCSSLAEVQQWAREEHAQGHGRAPTDTDSTPGAQSVRGRPCASVPYSVLVASAALSLLNVCCYLLDRQIAAQAAAFEKEGGFTERLYRTRQARRRRG
jgi:four helix bundle suffix protein